VKHLKSYTVHKDSKRHQNRIPNNQYKETVRINIRSTEHQKPNNRKSQEIIFKPDLSR